MDHVPQQPAQTPVQPHEEPLQYETPAIKKIGSMSENTKAQKSVV
jgi:hypothetical protein